MSAVISVSLTLINPNICNPPDVIFFVFEMGGDKRCLLAIRARDTVFWERICIVQVCLQAVVPLPPLALSTWHPSQMAMC